MKVEHAVRSTISAGDQLYTPSANRPFSVDRIDSEGIVLGLGDGRWPTRVSWECLDELIEFVRAHGGDVRIGGRHEVKGNPGTLDEHLKGCVKRTTAGWVAAVLERAGIFTVIRVRPARVRLTVDWA